MGLKMGSARDAEGESSGGRSDDQKTESSVPLSKENKATRSPAKQRKEIGVHDDPNGL